MKDTKEIILFYDEKTTFDLKSITDEIMSRYDVLKDPVIVPEKDKKFLIVFNKDEELQMEINQDNVIIVMKEAYFKEVNSIVFDIVDAFEMFNVKFSRIGYIASKFLNQSYIEKAKNKYLKVEEFADVLELNLNWYKKLNFKKNYINCWERIITDTVHFKELLVQFDINTPVGEKVDIDMKFIKEFFNCADEYIDTRVDL